MHSRCDFCRDLSFQEEVFCDLNRSTQNPALFECHAFQPSLKLITLSGRENQPEFKVQSVETRLEELLNSDKFKYQRALALQKWAQNPDDMMLNIKYHFAWNVISRIPVFTESVSAIDFINNIIMSCSEAVCGFACLLWLAPDHIHLYVESDGEVSPDHMARKLKRLSERPILERFPDLIASLEAKGKLWAEAYFVETIG